MPRVLYLAKSGKSKLHSLKDIKLAETSLSRNSSLSPLKKRSDH